jgi:hypothetical protein
MVRRKPDLSDLQAAIRAMPDINNFDRLLHAAAVRLELLGFAELSDAVDEIVSFGEPEVEIPVIERIQTVATATGWAMQEETKVDREWGITTTTLTLTRGRNTIDATIGGHGMHLRDARWRIKGVGYQFHEILATQRKYHRVETVLEWMRRAVVEPTAEGEDVE